MKHLRNAEVAEATTEKSYTLGTGYKQKSFICVNPDANEFDDKSDLYSVCEKLDTRMMQEYVKYTSIGEIGDLVMLFGDFDAKSKKYKNVIKMKISFGMSANQNGFYMNQYNVEGALKALIFSNEMKSIKLNFERFVDCYLLRTFDIDVLMSCFDVVKDGTTRQIDASDFNYRFNSQKGSFMLNNKFYVLYGIDVDYRDETELKMYSNPMAVASFENKYTFEQLVKSLEYKGGFAGETLSWKEYTQKEVESLIKDNNKYKQWSLTSNLEAAIDEDNQSISADDDDMPF